ncbi:hypothetical protein B0H13DRAFT_1888479 [Mycena leptocephala]|nr:hypothetical protein B0H13DRAFT_1888479 [Mycena leptocephala]
MVPARRDIFVERSPGGVACVVKDAPPDAEAESARSQGPTDGGFGVLYAYRQHSISGGRAGKRQAGWQEMVAKDIEAGEQRKTQSERLTVITPMCIIIFETIEPTPSTERRPNDAADNDTLFFQMTRCGHPRCARCDSELSDGQWRGGEVRFLSSFGRTSVRSWGPALSGRYGAENEDDVPRRDPYSFAPCPVRVLAVPALGFSSGSQEETLAGGRVILLQVEGDSEQE